jgi:maltooligosyltrehalose trehalohydrolase
MLGFIAYVTLQRGHKQGGVMTLQVDARHPPSKERTAPDKLDSMSSPARTEAESTGAIVPGATSVSDTVTRFSVWAPEHERIDVHILSPEDRLAPMERTDRGYHVAIGEGVGEGVTYKFRLSDGRELPDPASRFQPEGVHGPSQVVNTSFAWSDDGWRGIPLAEYVIYELHVGTFTPEGTFDGVIDRLDELKELGITAVELMPVAQFPGERNWGYDGVGLFAPQNSYGGPGGLRRFVDACHARGIAAILDVVYNHLGPEGNYLREFGPYFTDKYQLFWGDAINYDGSDSDEVRRYFIENALMWVRDYHFDALRLDAVHGIFDQSAKPFLRELADDIRAESDRLDRRIQLIAESDLNDPQLVRPADAGGSGLDAQWSDDFHHALHSLLTGERDGYYADYGGVGQLAKCYRRAYAFAGEYSAFRRRRHGQPPTGLPGEAFVVCAQNHDQVGNRMLGERLASLTSLEGLKLAAAATILSPFIPLLFMGEEYGESAPFLFFVDHADPELLKAVNAGRIKEFEAFGWTEHPPEPGDPDTFDRSRPNPAQASSGRGAVLRSFYRELLRLRRETPALAHLSLDDIEVTEDETDRTITVRRWHGDSQVLIAMNFAEAPASVSIASRWRKLLDSADARWSGPGTTAPERIADETILLAPQSVAVYSAGG